MKEINVIDLDLAKNIFQVYGVNRQGEGTISRKLTRTQMHRYFAQLSPISLVWKRVAIVITGHVT